MNAQLNLFALFVLCLTVVHAQVTGIQTLLEVFEGQTVTLPCTIASQGDLQWYGGHMLILVKLMTGETQIFNDTRYTDAARLVDGTNNLRISNLQYDRDNEVTFRCVTSAVFDFQETHVRVVAMVTAARIEPPNQGLVRIKEGDSQVFTCTAIGEPNPFPIYSWYVDDRGVSQQGPVYSLRAERSMKTVKCTATNTYNNGSVLSTAEDQAKLNVIYLDQPMTTPSVTVTENDRITLECSVEGNPPPSFQWKRSGSEDVLGTSGNYTIDNVQRSDAGEYRCSASNDVGNKANVSSLIVQYPPDLNVTFDENTGTLMCIANGVPDTYTFSVWRHRLGGTDIRTLGTASKSYTFPGTLTYQDTGEYSCSVTNGIESEQHRQIYVAPQTAAVFQNQSNIITVGIGKPQKISALYYANPSSGSAQVEWIKSGDSVTLESHVETGGVVSLLIYDKRVNIQGTITELTLANVSEADLGTYTVTVKTDIRGVTEARSVSFNVEVNVTEEKPTGRPVNTLVLVGGVLGGVVAGISITLIIVGLCRRCTSKGSSEAQNTRELTTVNSNQRQDHAVEVPGAEYEYVTYQGNDRVRNDSYLKPVVGRSTGNARMSPSKDGQNVIDPATNYETLNSSGRASTGGPYELINNYN